MSEDGQAEHPGRDHGRHAQGSRGRAAQLGCRYFTPCTLRQPPAGCPGPGPYARPSHLPPTSTPMSRNSWMRSEKAIISVGHTKVQSMG